MPGPFLFSNNARSALTGSVAPSSTVLNLTPGSGALFPNPGVGQLFVIVLANNPDNFVYEYCECTARSGDVLTVNRGVDGSTALSWGVGTIVAEIVTAEVLNAFQQGPDNTPSVAVAGANVVYSNSALGSNIVRSNAGTTMIDTIPTDGSLTTNSSFSITNGDATAVLVLKGGITGRGYTYLGPSQSVTILTSGVKNYAFGLPDRCTLFSDLTLFCSATGIGTNTGATSADPLPPNSIASFVQSFFDLQGFNLTIQCLDGTYNATSFSFVGSLFGQGDGVFTVKGNSATPDNCIINASGKSAFSASFGAHIVVDGFKITSASSNGFSATQGGVIDFKNIDFGVCAGSQIQTDGGVVNARTNWTQSGSATNFMHVTGTGQVNTIGFDGTFVGSIGYTTTIAAIDGGRVEMTGTTWTGTCTGTRYSTTNGSLINTGGAGTTVIPGNVAGVGTDFSTAPWGLYQ